MSTHEEIAQLIGTSRETIARTLAEFGSSDIVELKNSIVIIHNKPALERMWRRNRPGSKSLRG